MPTNEEVKETFYDNYSLILDDYLYKLKKICVDNQINILNDTDVSTNIDFVDLIFENCDLKKTFTSKNIVFKENTNN